MNQEEEDFRGYASPPCYQHEFDAESASKSREEIVARLNELLEGERAGAMGLIEMKTGVNEELGTVLDAVAKDEGRFCSMLRRHVSRLGYEPSRRTGVFYDKLLKRRTLDDKLRLLDRGQSAVVLMLDDLLPSIGDADLRRDLEEMRDVHIRNIAWCAQYLVDQPVDRSAD